MLEDERRVLYQLQQVDVTVYRHFADKFQHQVVQFGAAEMQRSVRELRRINQHVSWQGSNAVAPTVTWL